MVPDPTEAAQPPSRAAKPALPELLPDGAHGPVGGQSLVLGLVAAAIILAGLYFGRELIIPLALAILLGFVLDPLVTRLRRWNVPRVAAVALVVGATFTLVAAGGYFVAHQVRMLASELPVYQSNISQKLRDFRKTVEQPGVIDQLSSVAGAVKKELETPEPSGPVATARPLQRVEVVQAPPDAIERLGSLVERVFAPAATAGIVIVFLVLILLDTGDLRDRLLRLFGGNLHRTTDALAEAGRRVSRYLTMQLVVNATYGVPMALALWFIGVPGALLWGLVAAVLRFVPYVGPVISAVFPLTLAFAVDPGWNMTLWTVGVIIVLELVSNNIVEPWLYGSSTGLSPLSLIAAATFWTALWGPIGLVMSTPITVVLLVLGRYLPQLAFIDILLGSSPALDMPTRLYQRLLAGDNDEAIDLALEEVEKTTPQAFYNEAGVPALRLATNAHATVATAEHRLRLVAGMEQLIAELRQQAPVDDPGRAHEVLCIGARWEVDSLAADMAAHALALAGHPSRMSAGSAPSADDFARMDLEQAPLVVLSYFSPEPAAHARYLLRRLKRRWPDLRVLIAAWNIVGSDAAATLQERTGAEAVVLSIDELTAVVEHLVAGEAAPPFAAAPVPEDDAARVAALHASGLLDEAMQPALEAIAKRAADVFDVDRAEVSLIDEHRQHSRGVVRARAGGQAIEESVVERERSLCAHVVAAKQTLVVPDVARDPRFASNPQLRDAGVRFYAGAALCDGDGFVLGTLCLLHKAPRSLNSREVLLLETMAGEVITAARQAREAASAPAPAPVVAPAAT